MKDNGSLKMIENILNKNLTKKNIQQKIMTLTVNITCENVEFCSSCTFPTKAQPAVEFKHTSESKRKPSSLMTMVYTTPVMYWKKI